MKTGDLWCSNALELGRRMENHSTMTGACAASVAGQNVSSHPTKGLRRKISDNDNIAQHSREGVGWGFAIGGIASGHARNTAGAAVGGDFDLESEEARDSQKPTAKRK